MTINTAFCIFAKAVVRSRSIPFKIEADTISPAEAGRSAFRALRQQTQNELTIDEINEEIGNYRKGL